MQRYRLTISNAAIEAPVGDPVMVINVADGGIVDVGNVAVNTTGGTNLTVSNQGEGLLELSIADISGPTSNAFEVTVPNTVAAGGSGVVGISFTPTLTELSQAFVTLSTNDPAQPDFSFTVQGTGITARILQR